MERELVFADGQSIIGGEDMRDIVSIFPELKDQFTQRKTYDEYYYTSKEVFITTEIIDALTSNWYSIKITSSEIIIL